MKIRLIVDFENFEMIKSGQKKEEYRALNAKNNALFCFKNKQTGTFDELKPITEIEFQRGYTPEFITVECKQVFVDEWLDNVPEGLKKGSETYTCELGAVIA